MAAVPQSCTAAVELCADVVDYTPVLVGVVLAVLVVLTALIVIGVRRFTR